MKRILLKRLLVASCFALLAVAMSEANAQTTPPGYTPDGKRNDVRSIKVYEAFHAPAGGSVSLPSKNWVGAGAIYIDTTGVDSGFYYYKSRQFWKVAELKDTALIIATKSDITGAPTEVAFFHPTTGRLTSNGASNPKFYYKAGGGATEGIVNILYSTGGTGEGPEGLFVADVDDIGFTRNIIYNRNINSNGAAAGFQTVLPAWDKETQWYHAGYNNSFVKGLMIRTSMPQMRFHVDSTAGIFSWNTGSLNAITVNQRMQLGAAFLDVYIDSFRTVRTANVKPITDSGAWYMKIRNRVSGVEADAYWPAGGAGGPTPDWDDVLAAPGGTTILGANYQISGGHKYLLQTDYSAYEVFASTGTAGFSIDSTGYASKGAGRSEFGSNGNGIYTEGSGSGSALARFKIRNNTGKTLFSIDSIQTRTVRMYSIPSIRDTATASTDLGHIKWTSPAEYAAIIEPYLTVGGGSGTVNSGTANTLAYYPAGSAVVDDLTAMTANRAVISDANGLPIHATTTSTEIGYVNGVTSSIQTQLNAKVGAVGTINSETKSANGAVRNGSNLVLQTVDATFPGLMTSANLADLENVKDSVEVQNEFLQSALGTPIFKAIDYNTIRVRTLLDSAGFAFLKTDTTITVHITSPSTVKTTLSLNNVDNTSDATKNSATATLTNKRWTARVGSTTSSATPTINTDNVDIYKLTAQTADITSFTTNLSGTPVDGDVLEIQVTGTAARAITWGASFVASTVALPTTTVTTATLTVIFQYFTTSSYGNNKWVCVNSF